MVIFKILIIKSSKSYESISLNVLRINKNSSNRIHKQITTVLKIYQPVNYHYQLNVQN